MKSKFPILALICSIVHAADADLHFRGVVAEKSRTTFGISDAATGISKWVALGGSFEDYVISEYDPKTETLSLKNSAGVCKLKLESAAFRSGAPDAERIRAEKTMLNDARQIAAASQQYMMETGRESVEFSVDPTDGTVSGPIAQYVKKIAPGTRVVQGKVGSYGTFILQRMDAFNGVAVKFDADGRKL